MITTVNTALADWQTMPLRSGQIAAWWLGQAGFLFRHGDVSFIIDPYLSDSLAVKYRDKPFKHIRMMPVPIEPAALTGIDWIFCTHQHTDHMDGVTLRALMAASPDCRLIASKAAAHHLVDVIGMDRTRLALVNPGQHLELHSGFTVDVMASAHEALDCDDAGHALYLGFVFDLAGTRLYHSGDCVPFEGLADTLKDLRVDMAMLPANGRDAHRTESGVPGNFHFEEAVSLCEEAGIDVLVVHHFGMFDFNTVDPSAWQAKRDGLDGRLQIVVPQINQGLLITR